MATYDFFLSFCSADLKLATAIHRILCEANYRVWFYPLDSPTGSFFTDRVNQGLEESAKVLAVLTPNYNESAVARREFDYGYDEGKLIVLRFGNASLPPLAKGLVYQQCEYAPEEPRFAEVVLAVAEARPVAPYQEEQRFEIQLLEERAPGTVFVGRKSELESIDRAFEDKECSVICVVAGGGFGKTSLVKAWIDRKNSTVRQRVSCGYAFSFRGQGLENAATSSDQFFEKALAYFVPDSPIEPSREKRSAKLLQDLKMRSQRSQPLLVLDGLEPLQDRADQASSGHINDETLRRFIGALVRDAGRTKTVITSRVMPDNLKRHVESGRVRVITPERYVVKIGLGKLNRAEGIELLKEARQNYKAPVSAALDDGTLDAIAEECEDHPLLLALMGPAVASGNYGLEELRRHRDPGEAGESLSFGDKLRKLLDSQLKALGPEAQAVLYSVCVFDDPILGHELRARLLGRARIPVFTAPLYQRGRLCRCRRFSETAFQKAVQKLEEAAILVPEKRGPDGTASPDPLDWTYLVHPVIQTDIRTTVAKEHGPAWKKANATVYLSLVYSVRKLRPSRKEEVRRLYAAIPHGIQAGWGRRTGWMYGLRCQRGYRAYSTNHLGMIGEDVEAMSHYFRGRWVHVRSDIGLHPFDEGLAYSWAGLVLIGTNQLNHGVRLMRKGMKIAEAAGSFITASRAARHLAFITALLGRKDESIQLAREALDLTGRRRPLTKWLLDLPLISMPYQRMTAHANLGCVLHYFGQHEEAEVEFQEAERIQARRHGRYPMLRAIWGYRYADLLLDLGRFKEADERFLAGLVDPDAPTGWGEGVFAAPLLKLGFVRSNVRQADLFGEKRNWDKVLEFEAELKKFGKAEDDDIAPLGAAESTARDTGRRKNAKKDYKNNRLDILVPAFRTATAGVARLLGKFDEALNQVDDAERVSKEAGIVLFDTEIAIERARIHLARGNRDSALASLAKVRGQPTEVAYRQGELERLLAQMGESGAAG